MSANSRNKPGGRHSPTKTVDYGNDAPYHTSWNNPDIPLPMKQLALIALLLGPPLALPGAAAPDLAEVIARNEPCVVVIHGSRTSNGAEVQSSGCVINAQGHVLTTAHQINGVDQFEGTFSDGHTTPLDLIAVDDKREIALLHADGEFDVFPTLGDPNTLRNGDTLIAIAAPRSLDFTAVTGRVANTRSTLRDYPVLLADMRAAPGSSGGPVFDENGVLVGLIIGKLRNEEWLIAVNRIDNALDIMDTFGVPVPGAPSPQADDTLLPAAGISPRELRAIEAYNRGVAARSHEDKTRAYEDAITLLPDFYRAWFNLGVAFARDGAWEQAEKAYRRARQLRPEAVEPSQNLGRLYLARNRLDKAASAFEHALEIEPESAQSFNDLGEVYRRQGKTNAALKAFHNAIEHDSTYALAHYNLGLLHAALGNAAQAVQAFQAYLTHRDDAPDALEVRQWIRRLESKRKNTQ